MTENLLAAVTFCFRCTKVENWWKNLRKLELNLPYLQLSQRRNRIIV